MLGKLKVRKFVLYIIFAVIFFASNYSFGSGEQSLHIGLNLAYSTFGGGDFDEHTYVTNEAVLISSPSFDAAGLALGFVLGYRMNDLISFEISYLSSSHDATFFDPRDNTSGTLSDKITRNQYIFNIKVHPKITNRLEAFGILGASLNGLHVENNFFLGDTYLVGNYDLRWRYKTAGDATFHGTGLNFGAGLQYKLTEKFMVSVSAMYNSLGFDDAYGKFKIGGEEVKQSYEFEKLKGKGYGILISFIYHLALFD